MLLTREEIVAELELLGIDRSSDARRLRDWVEANKHRLCDEEDCQIVSLNHYDTDQWRVYAVSFVRVHEEMKFVPAWSFLGFASKKKVPVQVRTEERLLTIQLGRCDDHLFNSQFYPGVTSESGVSVF
jgi:hypothetical protein